MPSQTLEQLDRLWNLLNSELQAERKARESAEKARTQAQAYANQIKTLCASVSSRKAA